VHYQKISNALTPSYSWSTAKIRKFSLPWQQWSVCGKFQWPR